MRRIFVSRELRVQELRIGELGVERQRTGQLLLGAIAATTTQQSERERGVGRGAIWSAFHRRFREGNRAATRIGHELGAIARQALLGESAKFAIQLVRRLSEHILQHITGALAGAPLPEHLAQLGHAVLGRPQGHDLTRGVVGRCHVVQLFGSGERARHIRHGRQAIPTQRLIQVRILFSGPLWAANDRSYSARPSVNQRGTWLFDN